MTTEYRVYLGGEPASDEALGRIRVLRVDQAIGMATEAELEMDLAIDDNGVWSGIDTDYAQPFERVRIEVKPDRADAFVALVDGPIVGQRFSLTEAAHGSRMTLVVHDDSVLLNREEGVELYQDMSASDIARRLFGDAGLTPEVDAVEGPAADPDQVVVRRGTPMQLLRQLARRHGMFVYVRPGGSTGSSVGHFRRPDLGDGGQAPLRVTGQGRNVGRFDCEFDGLRPTRASARGITLADRSEQEGVSGQSGLDPLGARASLDLVPAGQTLLAGTRAGDADLEAVVTATVDVSSWAYSAAVELDGDAYGEVLEPYRTITVAGAGGYLGGPWLISRVLHTLTAGSYLQQVSLRRNARSDVAGGGAAAAVAGVF